MIKILFPCHTQPEMETLLSIINTLPDNVKCIVVCDSKYDIISNWKKITDSKIFLIPLETIRKNMREFLRQENISLIVTAHDSSFLSSLILLSRKNVGIPSIFVPHGIIAESKRSLVDGLRTLANADSNKHIADMISRFLASGCFLNAVKIWIHKVLSGSYVFPIWDKVCVAGPIYRDRFLREGVNKGAIVITGQPRYDKFTALNMKLCKKNVCEIFGLDGKKKIVIIATQPFIGKTVWDEASLQYFIRIMKRMELQPIIKVHPRENQEIYKSILAKIGFEHIPVIKNEISLYELICACDLFVTVSSTTALEAMILDKPVITINFSNKPDDFPYAKSGAAIGVYKKENLETAIKDALYSEDIRKKLSESRKRFIYEYAYFQDGKASKRVADLIMQMIEESKTK